MSSADISRVVDAMPGGLHRVWHLDRGIVETLEALPFPRYNYPPVDRPTRLPATGTAGLTAHRSH